MSSSCEEAAGLGGKLCVYAKARLFVSHVRLIRESQVRSAKVGTHALGSWRRPQNPSRLDSLVREYED